MRSLPFYLPLDNAPTEKVCKGSRACINHILPSPQTHLTRIQRQCHLGPKLFILKLPHRFGTRHPDLHPRLFWDYVSLPGECSAGTDTHHQCWQGAEQSQKPSLAWVPPHNTLQAWSAPTTLRIADKGGVRASPQVQPSWLASDLQDIFSLLQCGGLNLGAKHTENPTAAACSGHPQCLKRCLGTRRLGRDGKLFSILEECVWGL